MILPVREHGRIPAGPLESVDCSHLNSQGPISCLLCCQQCTQPRTVYLRCVEFFFVVTLDTKALLVGLRTVFRQAVRG